MKHFQACAMIALWTLVSGCSKLAAPSTDTGGAETATPRGGEVVVYSSVDDVFARPLCEQYQRETGKRVLLVPDTEETKSTGLLNRLIAEKSRPQADVFWSGDPVRAAILKSKGISTAYMSPAAAGLPPEYSDPDGHWTGFSARARLLIYNKNLLSQDQKPESVRDLADPRFKGKACLANPLFGTTSMHAAALFQVMGDDKAKAFFESLSKNSVKILSSNGEVRRRVANGEYAVGLTDTDDAHVAMLEGKPVDVIYPDADGMGTLIVPNAAVLIAGCPHAADAKKFIDYLLSPATEEALAKSEAAQMPLRSNASVPAGITPITAIKPMTVDYATLADKLEELSSGFLKDWVDQHQ